MLGIVGSITAMAPLSSCFRYWPGCSAIWYANDSGAAASRIWMICSVPSGVGRRIVSVDGAVSAYSTAVPFTLWGAGAPADVAAGVPHLAAPLEPIVSVAADPPSADALSGATLGKSDKR